MSLPEQDRKYSTEDYGTARFCLENRIMDGSSLAMFTVVNDLSGLTVARAQRLKHLNLLDGDVATTVDTEPVRLSGLGVKTAEEAIRLGIPAVT